MQTQNGITVEEIRKEINTLTEKLLKIQEQCSHPSLCVEVSNTDIGEYSLEIVTDYHCKLCDKKWSSKGENKCQ